jgi:hypothetical protein
VKGGARGGQHGGVGVGESSNGSHTHTASLKVQQVKTVYTVNASGRGGHYNHQIANNARATDASDNALKCHWWTGM